MTRLKISVPPNICFPPWVRGLGGCTKATREQAPGRVLAFTFENESNDDVKYEAMNTPNSNSFMILLY